MKTTRALLLGALLAFVPAATSSQAEPFPPLPETIPSYYGPVRVIRTPSPLICGAPAAPGFETLGCYTAATRKLEVLEGLAPQRAWFVLEHERIHMILSDAHLRLDNEEQEQAIADAIATSRVVERLSGNP